MAQQASEAPLTMRQRQVMLIVRAAQSPGFVPSAAIKAVKGRVVYISASSIKDEMMRRCAIEPGSSFAAHRTCQALVRKGLLKTVGKEVALFAPADGGDA